MQSVIIDKSFSSIESIAELLNLDKVGAIPCDTIYGISARANDVNAEKIFEIKKRPQNKSLITLISLEDLRLSSLKVPSVLYDVYPAPLTAILMDEVGTTHAIRVPSDPFMLHLLPLSGPIFSTSVNISGERSLLTFNDVLSAFDKTLDFIVKTNDVSEGVPSTIIDMTQKPYRVIRMGAYDPHALI